METKAPMAMPGSFVQPVFPIVAAASVYGKSEQAFEPWRGLSQRYRTVKNPIIEAREARGMSRKQLALVLDVHYNQVACLETGIAKQIPAPWRERLVNAGFNADALAEDYQAWRRSVVAELADRRPA